MKNEEFRKYAHQMVDWIADYFEDIEEYRVKPKVTPGEIAGSIPSEPPLKGETMDDIFEGFKENIMPGITHWQHPGWFAYFPANSSPPSVLGEFLTAGLGVQGMVWDTSPAATELEEVVMNWLRQMIGLPDNFTGVLQDTASTATLCALISAREKVTDFKTNQTGFHQKLRIYASNQTHSSIEKGGRIAGFGKENLVYIDTDDHFEFTAPPNLTLVCFRLVKEGMPEEEINSMNEKLLRIINDQGDIYLTHTKLNGRYTIRMSIAQRNTKQHHVEKAWEIITEAGKSLIK